MQFDISKVEFSRNDIKRGLRLPKYPSEDLAEFVGILIGDGYLHNNKKKYVIGIVGNPKTDLNYFLKIQKMVLGLFNVNTKIRKIGRGLRLVFNSKGVFSFLIMIGMEYGKGKGERVNIPKSLLIDKKISGKLLRGVFDTDGTIFTSYKKGSPEYPCIELTTTSPCLAIQTKELLSEKGFRVAGIRKYNYKNSKLISHKVSLYGIKNILRWNNDIGFSHTQKNEKLQNIIKKWGRWDLNPGHLRLQRSLRLPEPKLRQCSP